MDTARWPQEIGLVKAMDQDHHLQLVASSTATAAATTPPTSTTINTSHMGGNTRLQVMERRTRPQKEQALNCPRCNSTNTKFCYYNNYSLSQPRYFCKTCRRYWTEGGSLRNVPVGGGSRKNKRSSSSSASPSPSTTATNSIISTTSTAAASMISLSSSSSHQNPKFHEGQDLNLAFPHPSLPREFGEFPNLASNTSSCCTTTSNAIPSTGNALSAMELLRNTARGMPSFMQLPVPETINYNSTGAFGLHDLRPAATLNFPLDASNNTAVGNSSSYGAMQENSSGRMLFPFEDLRQVSNNTNSTTAANGADEFEHNRSGQHGAGDHQQPAAGFWNQMMGGGGSW